MAFALVAATLALVGLAGPQDPAQAAGWPRVVTPLSFSALWMIGILIAARHVGNPIGWILCCGGFVGLIGEFAGQYANVGLAHRSGSLPGVAVMAWFASLTATATVFPCVTFGLLLFPDGRLPSRRWRPLAWCAAASTVVFVSTQAFAPGPLPMEFPAISNPIGVEAAPRAFHIVGVVAATCLVACVLGSVASTFVRLGGSAGLQRLQLKWVTYGAFLGGVELVVSILWPPANDVDRPILITTLGAAFAAAIFAHRLYDIDLIISKTIAYGSLAVVIAGGYVAVLVGVGAAIGAAGGSNLVLSMIATAVVAVAFQPSRRRFERLARALVYGKRADPYQMLSRFSAQLGGAGPPDEMLPAMARVLAEETGLAAVEIWARTRTTHVCVAAWPERASRPAPQPLDIGELPQSSGARARIAVREGGELLGALVLTGPAGGAPSRAQLEILPDLAAQVGLVLRNLQLIEDLRASRMRLVAARDAERRRLERDIRQRVEHRIARVAESLSAADGLVPAGADWPLLSRLRKETAAAASEIRDLARGVYPALLTDEGPVAALTAQIRDSRMSTRIEANGISRYPLEIEAAVYFCCLEAVQNVTKHAQAARSVVRLSMHAGGLRFSVEDDGRGFDPDRPTRGAGLQNMVDRLEALGGRLRVRSAPAEGTTITGWLPGVPLELER